MGFEKYCKHATKYRAPNSAFASPAISAAGTLCEQTPSGTALKPGTSCGRTSTLAAALVAGSLTKTSRDALRIKAFCAQSEGGQADRHRTSGETLLIKLPLPLARGSSTDPPDLNVARSCEDALCARTGTEVAGVDAALAVADAWAPPVGNRSGRGRGTAGPKLRTDRSLWGTLWPTVCCPSANIFEGGLPAARPLLSFGELSLRFTVRGAPEHAELGSNGTDAIRDTRAGTDWELCIP